VRDATQNAETLAQEKMGAASGGFGGDLGAGMPDLQDFFGPGGDDDKPRPSLGF
jgi:hypothetical protein